MNRIALLALVVVCVATPLQAATDWSTAYSGMMNRDQVSTWIPQDGDNLTKIVKSTYGVSDQKSIDTVIDALIKYNNALAKSGQYNGDKVTLITNRDLIFAGKPYVMPDPDSLNKLMQGGSADDVVKSSMAKESNKKVAMGEVNSCTPYTFGESSGSSTTPPTGPSPSPAPPTVPNQPGATPISLLDQPMEMVTPLNTTVPSSLEASYLGLNLDTSTFTVRDFSNTRIINGTAGNNTIAAAGASIGSQQ